MRGQISLDLILAVGVGLIAIGTASFVGNELIELQKISGIRQQLDTIGNSMAATISTSTVLSDAASARVDFEIPRLLVLGENQPQPCNITIGANQITLEYDIIDLQAGTSTPVAVTKKTVNTAGMGFSNNRPKCGETLTMTR